MDNQELKPCPFCGSNDLICFYNGEYEGYVLQCNSCCSSMWADEAYIQEIDAIYDEVELSNDNIARIKPLIDKWNRRINESTKP